MTPEIKIYKNVDCSIEITGLEIANNSYIANTPATAGEFSFLDTISIFGIYKVNSSEEKTLKETIISEHKLQSIDDVMYDIPDSAIYKLLQDGLYEIVRVIIPLKDWIESFRTINNYDPTDIYENVYVYDSACIYLYTLIDSVLTYTKVDFETIFNNFSTTNKIAYNTIYICESTFSICKLEKCLFNISVNLFKLYCPMNCSISKSSDLILKRDLLWMAKNTIKYLLEKGNFIEALRIMELFLGCNDFCNDGNNNLGGSSCGCGSNN